MHQGQTATKKLKDKGETPMVLLYAGQINETTTLFIPTEEERSQATAEDHDLRFLKRVLSGMEETPIKK